MTRARLSREVRALLETDLDSLEKVELIRHLRGARGPVPRAELARELHLEDALAGARLAELVRARLVEHDGQRGRLRLGPGARAAVVEELMQIYEEDRLAVVAALSSMAVERIRGMAARAFGEALVSKKKPSEDG